mgnify:CR=1 FL=1
MDPQLAPQRRLLIRRIMIDLTVMVAIGVFLGVIGPFGSIAAPLPVRIASWIGFALLGYVFYRPMDPLATWAHRTLDLPRWALLIGTCLIATVPMSFAVIAIGSLPDAPSWPGLEPALATYFSVLVIGGAVTAFFNLAKPGQSAPAAPSSAATAPPPMAAPGPIPAPMLSPVFAPPPPPPSSTLLPNPLVDQLPADLGSDIIALEMEDHYVRVHTALGSALVLMRLRDAMALVEGEGMQVHRSWWVARHAVEDVLRDGRNIRLKLARGIEAPVARANVAALRDARWI